MAIEIEKYVPIPEKKFFRKASEPKYPFAEMEVGDSFSVASDKKSISNLVGARGKFMKSNPSIKFTSRTCSEEGVYRTWRTE